MARDKEEYEEELEKEIKTIKYKIERSIDYIYSIDVLNRKLLSDPRSIAKVRSFMKNLLEIHNFNKRYSSSLSRVSYLFRKLERDCGEIREDFYLAVGMSRSFLLSKPQIGIVGEIKGLEKIESASQICLFEELIDSCIGCIWFYIHAHLILGCESLLSGKNMALFLNRYKKLKKNRLNFSALAKQLKTHNDLQLHVEDKEQSK